MSHRMTTRVRLHVRRVDLHPSLSGQRGFSLIEVLVAVFVLSIGMLGSVGMQTAALKANTQTRYLNSATTLARELAEKMRANHQVSIVKDAATNPFLVSYTAEVPAAPALNCFKGECLATGPEAMRDSARWETYEWLMKTREQLPTPRVVVCFDSDPFDASGKARWACDGLGDTTVVKMAWTNTNTQGGIEFATGAGVPLVVLPLTAGSPE